MVTSRVKDTPILVVAALGRELKALGSERHAELELLETGEGIANARRSIEDWLEQRSARVVLSIGFAGALSAALRIGDLVVAETIRSSEIAPDPNLLAIARHVRLDNPVHFGTALTAERILWLSSEKRALASPLAADEIGFVDMESTAIADVCAQRNVPFLIVRSISDLLDEDLPLDFNQCMDRDGRVNSGKVTKAALVKPRSIKGLLELRKRSELCAERMAEFIRGILLLIDQSKDG